MAIKIQFDVTNNPEKPTFVLAKRNGDKIGLIEAEDIVIKDTLNNGGSEISFVVYKTKDTVDNPIWDKIKNFKLVWCKEWDRWFDISVEIDESDKTVKNVEGVQLGVSELSQIMLYNIEINTEDDIAREDYVTPTIFYDEKDKTISLLDRILEKANHYSISHVDSTLTKIQRTFSFDGTSIYDALNSISEEIKCLFVFDSNTNSNGKPNRIISVYDLEQNCMDCGHRGEFTLSCPKCHSKNIRYGYGNDTNIFITSDELAEDVKLTTDIGAVKNCFKLQAGDDLMTATIRNCNPNGSDYIWYITEEFKSDMSAQLSEKLNTYNNIYNEYQTNHIYELPQEYVNKYNELVDKYNDFLKTFQEETEFPVSNKVLTKLNSEILSYPNLMIAYYDTIDLNVFLQSTLMPNGKIDDTNAEEQAELLTPENMGVVAVTNLNSLSLGSADNAVLSVAKTIIDNRYQVKIKESSLNEHIWTGVFTVTDYSDDKNTANSKSISISISDDYEKYTEQRLQKVLHKDDSVDVSVTGLFKREYEDFCNEIKKYCLHELQSFLNVGQSCIDILIEQGIANKETWSAREPNLYDDLYIPYYKKMQAVENEILIRQNEINLITGIYDNEQGLVKYGVQNYIIDLKNETQQVLDFQEYLGEDLWLEFCTYRREDKFQNDNYISDGLNNAELFTKALEFLEKANKEIYKSAELQHSISTTLKNLLAIDKFKPLAESFEVGNWIRIRIDDKIYKLRLIQYQIEYNDLNNINVEFSDLTKIQDGITDVENLLSKTSTMATTYNSVKRQSEKGSDSKKELDNWVANGLELTKQKIVDNVENNNLVIDSHGLLCRQFYPITENYDDKQLKIINKGLYLTDDNWQTVRTGVGDFQYYDPETKEEKESYGIIANTLIGNLILSEKVGIYNKFGSIKLDENGLVITVDTIRITEPITTFTIQKKYLDGTETEIIKPMLYADSEGNLNFAGTLNGANGEFSGKVTATSGFIGDGNNGWTIGSTYIYNKKDSLTSATQGVYVGTDGLSLGKDDDKFVVKPDGSFISTNADISGTVTSNKGSIGGWIVEENTIKSENNQMKLALDSEGNPSITLSIKDVKDELKMYNVAKLLPNGLMFYRRNGSVSGGLAYHKEYDWVSLEGIDEVSALVVNAGNIHGKHYAIYDNDDNYISLSLKTATLSDGTKITYLGA